MYVMNHLVLSETGLCSHLPLIHNPTTMTNLEGLTPEQKKFITGLSKRIQSLESKLVVLQAKMVKIDPSLMASLAQNLKQINLN
jgi:hypothetical protein